MAKVYTGKNTTSVGTVPGPVRDPNILRAYADQAGRVPDYIRSSFAGSTRDSLVDLLPPVASTAASGRQSPVSGGVLTAPHAQPFQTTPFAKSMLRDRQEQAAIMNTGFTASSRYDATRDLTRMPQATGLPTYGAGRTVGNLGVGAAGAAGALGATAGILGAAGPVTAAGVGATTSIGAVAGLGAWAGPIGALAGAGLAIGLGGKDEYYASGGLHDAIDNTLGRIPIVGGVLDFATDAVQGVFDFFGLGSLFGGNREAKQAREKYMKERQITWRHLQIANNRRWTNFDIDSNHVRRNQAIQDLFLSLQQGLDRDKWNEEDLINDQSFIRNLGLSNVAFNLNRWRANTLGALGDQKAWTDTNIANNFANAALAQNINTMLQRAGLEANTAVIANAISTNLMKRVGAIQDATSDRKGALADFAYRGNQQIEDEAYATAVQLDKVGAKRDMMRVVDAWNTKAKMETRANEKLFRGDQIQQQRFQDRVAQQQHKAKLLMSGSGAKGSADKADPIRAQRISMLAKLNGAQSMAAEKLTKISKIGESLDFVRDSVQRDPENWNQSKKQLQFMLDALDDL